MSNLIIKGGKYLVDGQELDTGMAIRRYDPIAQHWFSGEVGIVYGYIHETRERAITFGLVAPGYAPSPLVEGDEIEIMSDEEEAERAEDEESEAREEAERT